jgi:hypothetical protein
MTTDERIEALERQVKTGFEEMAVAQDRKLTELKDSVVEQMRDMQTELLRGFAAFSEGQTIRLRKVEADQSNLDAALSGRASPLWNGDSPKSSFA